MEEKELLKIIEESARDGRKKLDLSYKKIKSLPAEIGKLKNLTKLDLKYNQLSSLPPEIGNLKNLTNLNLDGNQISSLPAEIGNLKKLTSLDLDGNQLNSIPPVIYKLDNLRSLQIGGNGISSLGSGIGNLNNLRKFTLVGNHLQSLPAEIGNLKNLNWLVISNNSLKSLPAEIWKLKNLTRLGLGGNKLSFIPVEVGTLKKLTYLYWWNNELSSLPSEIGNLGNLVELSLGENQISSLPTEIGNLKNLKEIYLQKNRFVNVPTLTGLSKLEILNLQENQISELPRQIVDLWMEIRWEWEPNVDGIFLADNPWETPPVEIVKQGKQAILNYFKEIEARETDNLYEAKLLLIGEERAGKSSLAEALTNPNYVFKDKKSTQGIDIIKWVVPKKEAGLKKDFRMNIWDFGGQEIYHSTHQFFLTKRSIYFLVTEARKDVRHEDFYYWLNLTRILGSESPVVIIQNKCDQPSSGLAVREYQEHFSHIVESPQNVSCKNEYKETIEALRAATKRIIKNRMLLPDIGRELPKVWVDIRERLEEIRTEGKNYISYVEYVDLCKSFGMDEERAAFLAEYFHDLGVFLHFKDDLELKKTVFLNHEWVLRGVYNVLDNKKIIQKHGEFNNRDLEDIWHEDKFRGKETELLALMKNEKFGLCFNLGHGRYLAPKLLPKDMPEKLYGFERLEELKQPLHYQYRYKFMPKGILTRLIVELNNYIYKNTYWRYGVLMEFDKTSALVRERYFDRRIIIVLEGENKKEMLGIIRKNIKDINDTFENLEIQEMIPCNCSKCKGSPEPYYYRLESLRRRLRDGQRMIQCDKSYENMNIHEILGDVVIYEKDKSGKRTFFVEKYFEKGNEMKIEKINISDSKVVFADNIGKVEYNENLGISVKELEELKAAIKALTEEKNEKLNTHYDEFKNAKTEEDKESIARKIKDFFIENGIAVARSLTVEALKIILMASI